MIWLQAASARVVARWTRLYTAGLSVKEFAVLEALLHASPALLSAEDLLETAWDEHADPFTTTVTVTISRLRRKLGDPPIITTTPGAGYRIASRTAQDQPPAI
jgi:DNA-binding response OmpR family regulator